MSVKWIVNHLTVETGTRNHDTDSLFANGTMQVAVIVSIRAVDPNNKDFYKLHSDTLSRIQLVDYCNPLNPLPQEWRVTETDWGYDHVFPGRLGDPEPPSDEPPSSDQSTAVQKIRFWVSSRKIEHKNIAAKIQQGNGVYLDTSGSTRGFDSHVTLTAETPARYTPSNIKIDKVEVKRGTVPGSGRYAEFSWVHYNYYVTSMVYDFRKYLAYYIDQGRPDPGQKDCYLWATDIPGDVAYMHYVWPYGQPSTTEVGLVRGNQGHNQLSVSIRIRERPAAACFTLMEFSGRDVKTLFGTAFEAPHRYVEIWDRYGNTSFFRPRWGSPPNEILLEEYAPRAGSEVDHSNDAQPEA